MSEKNIFLRRDLRMIIGLIIFLLVAIFALYAIDMRQHFLGGWAAQFYRFIIRT